MPVVGIPINTLSQVISQATAPAFLLGAVAAYVAVLVARLNRIADRIMSLATSALDAVEMPRAFTKAGIPRLRRSAKLIVRALECAIICGILTTLLVIVAFASAEIGFNNAFGAAALFALAMSFFAASLVFLWIEVRLTVAGLSEYF
jgi:hypothetical protein